MNIREIGREVLSTEAREIEKAAAGIGEAFEKAVSCLFETRGRVVVTGMGKSGIIARKIAATFTSTGTPAVFLHPAEAIHGDIGIISEEDTVLALSSSGETHELVLLLGFIRRLDVQIISITGDTSSTLARESDIAINYAIKEEACPINMVPTTSTTLTMALGDALAIALMNMKEFTRDDFQYYHPGGSIGKKLLKVKQVMHANRDLPVVREDTPMSRVIGVINEKKFGMAVVLNGRRQVTGIITDGDLRRKFLEGVSFQQVQARNCMTPEPVTINEETLCSEALKMMEDQKITSLIVVKDHHLQGLVHLHDLWKTELI